MKRPLNPQPREILDILARRGPETRIAVVGASNNPEKYGHVIVQNLLAKGYTVLPVNPRESAIAGVPAYASLADVPGPVHVVSVVTPPAVTRRVLDDVRTLGLPNVFLQDGSYDDAVLEFAAMGSFRTMYEACIMVVTNR